MKLYDFGIVIIIGVIAVCAIGGYVSSRYLGNDNPIEEAAEEVIEEETGLDVDLSPDSKETHG